MRSPGSSILIWLVLPLILMSGNAVACRCSSPFSEGASVPVSTPKDARLSIASKPIDTPSPGLSLPTDTYTALVTASPTPTFIGPTGTPTTNYNHTPSANPTGSPTITSAPPTSTPTRTPTPIPTPLPTYNQSPTPALSPTSPPPLIPRPTGTPTAVPATPTPTLSPGWHVINDTSYSDAEGWIHVLGEIVNNTGANQEDVLLTVFFYDELNRQVGEEPAAPIVEVIPQDSKVPFSLETELRVPYERYEITVDAVPTDREPRIDLEVLNHAGTTGEIYIITGEVYNPGNPLLAYAEVIATLYDDAGLVVNVGYSFLPAGDLGSGQTASFEVLVEQPHESIASYELVVLGF